MMTSTDQIGKKVSACMLNRVNILGIDIDNVSFQEALDKVDHIIESNTSSYIVTPNVDHVVKLQKDPAFRRIYIEASLVLADGVPLIWASNLLRSPIKEKVSGSDLLPGLCSVAAKRGYKIFFLGGRDGAAKLAAEKLTKKFPDLRIVGVLSPPFGFENDEAVNANIIKTIRVARPDILFVGLGAPKQEKWIYRHRKEYGVPLSIGVGVTFEYVSGMVRRAPVWMQKSGLEWFFRLVQEPRRLWKRYLVDDLAFVRLVLKEFLFRKKNTV